MKRFAVVLLLLLSVKLDAQSRDTTMVPRELVRALVGWGPFGTGRNAEIVVGRVADEKLTTLVPRNARVLGGVVYRGAREGRSTTILALPENPDSTLVLLSRALERAGYKSASTLESTRGERGGFVATAIASPMGGNALIYCSDSESITVTVSEGGERGSIVHLLATGSLRYTACDLSMRDRMRGGSEWEIELPTLRPPAGATLGRSGGGSSSDGERESRARVGSSLSAVELIDHFVPQLRDQGWTLGNRASDGDLSVQTARRVNQKGDTLYLALADYRYTPRDHEVNLRVWMPSRFP
jgi:hypothetical protein